LSTGTVECPSSDAFYKAGRPSQYVLRPDDQIKIWVLRVEEISDKPVRVDPSGDIDLT
jgi:protein involved in polysaccharide export with SLBB domain